MNDSINSADIDHCSALHALKKIRPEIKIYMTREEREKERENYTKFLPVPLIFCKNSSYTAQNDPSEMSTKKDSYSILFQSFLSNDYLNIFRK